MVLVKWWRWELRTQHIIHSILTCLKSKWHTLNSAHTPCTSKHPHLTKHSSAHTHTMNHLSKLSLQKTPSEERHQAKEREKDGILSTGVSVTLDCCNRMPQSGWPNNKHPLVRVLEAWNSGRFGDWWGPFLVCRWLSSIMSSRGLSLLHVLEHRDCVPLLFIRTLIPSWGPTLIT